MYAESPGKASASLPNLVSALVDVGLNKLLIRGCNFSLSDRLSTVTTSFDDILYYIINQWTVDQSVSVDRIINQISRIIRMDRQ